MKRDVDWGVVFAVIAVVVVYTLIAWFTRDLWV